MGTLREVQASGQPYDVGRQHGAAVADLIHHVADARWRLLACETGELFTDATRRSLGFLPRVEETYPAYVEEIRGLADGAGVPFEVAFFINVATELHFDPQRPTSPTQTGTSGAPATSAHLRSPSSTPGDGCSAAALAGPEGVVIGQNWDQPEDVSGRQIILHLYPDGGPEILMFTHAGVIGYIGMNGHGVAHVANQLLSPGWRPGLPHYFLKRRLLEARSVDECLGIIERTPVSSAGNYVLADRTRRIVDVELAPEGYRVLDGAPCQVHANHFTHPDLRPLERYLQVLPDSAARQHRLEATAPRRASVDAFQRVFSDHDGHPESICRHLHGEGTLGTAASIIMDIQAGRMYVAPGPPCETPYQEFALSRGLR
jgi:isopenicillin-N N-acyltransferase-like protein